MKATAPVAETKQHSLRLEEIIERKKEIRTRFIDRVQPIGRTKLYPSRLDDGKVLDEIEAECDVWSVPTGAFRDECRWRNEKL